MADSLFDRPASNLPMIIQPSKTEFGRPCDLPEERPSKKAIFPPAMLAASLLVLALAAASAFVFLPSIFQLAELPRHAVLAAQAGEALDAGRNEEVIDLAQECIDSFEPAARRLQEDLERTQPDLPTGSVSRAVRDEILNHGPLNDVAACYFYLGQAHRKLGQLDEARQAYESAAEFTFARVWEPKQEIFWPPAADAAYWLDKLSETH
jgi:tetratricopeptide (TPR) repeat protein